MTASGAENVHAIEIDGDFDDCQALVKGMFADKDFAEGARLSGVNSINWARIVAQSVYFHIAANALSGPGPVSFVVPTGNFGDAFSGYVAKQTGARIAKIMMATNSNDILSRTMATGRYERAKKSKFTLSPAMDIQVASNFERILFEAVGRDGAATKRLYEQFSQSGGFDIPAPAMAKLREHLSALAQSDEETLVTMAQHWAEGDGYLACPHTAVALGAGAKADPTLDAPIVTLATAHPAKFPETVSRATGFSPPLPRKCDDLFTREEIIEPLPNEARAVKAFISQRSRAWA
jgi:threonine synthase